MGKRARKTRWRALDIADEHSDSEESNTNSSAVSSRNSRSYSNGYYSKYSYSSQSTPARRRYNQYDGSAKSTRSSSTTSENKITFNEDEYTRITTPRQDVLFKKGYLNKPKVYHTQTSTGNSTVSTGNSTENGTPDHQSTDLDYESQFMFPNGFVDQNGIYYVNSYEPYPLMLFNPPTYYHECSNIKSKRMSTGSLSESASPNNEEATSQDLSPSGGDASTSVSDYSGGPPVYNMVFPGYYVNGACTPTDLANGQHFPQEPVKKLKKRRERKSSKNIQEDSSEYTDDNSCDENVEGSPHQRLCPAMTLPSEHPVDPALRLEVPILDMSQKGQDVSLNEAQAQVDDPKEESKTVSENSKLNDNTLSNGCADAKTESNDEKPDFDQAQPSSDCPKSSVLKPDAEEFVPRAYQNLGPPPHFKMLPPNFMPIPLVPISDFGGQNFAPHPAFIPPGIPVNFIPHHPGQKLFPAAPSFVNFAPPMIHETKIEENSDKNEETVCVEKESTATPSHTPVVEENKTVVHSKAIDIATVVSKLEAVQQQEKKGDVANEETPTVVVNETKPFIGSPRFKRPATFKRNYYNKYRSSPVRSGEASPQIENGENSPQLQHSPCRLKNSSVCNGAISSQKQINGETPNYINSPVRHVEVPPSGQNGHSDQSKYRNLPVRHTEVPPPTHSGNIDPPKFKNSLVCPFEVSQTVQNGFVTTKLFKNDINHSNKIQVTTSVHLPNTDNPKEVRDSPDRFRKNWKPNGYQKGYQNDYKNGYGNSKRIHNHQKQNHQKPIANGSEKPYINDDLGPTLNKNYSGTLKKAQIISDTSVAQPKKHINNENTITTVDNAADVPLKSELVRPKSNQWISVSSKKKKKYKNTEDIDFEPDQDRLDESTQSVSSDFEAYDINQLVDVVPASLVDQNPQQEKNIEDILTIIAENEPSEVLANGQQTPTDIKIPEVSDIENDIIVKMEETRELPSEAIPEETITLNLQSEEKKCELVTAKEIVSQVNDDQGDIFKPKKKSKKGTQKPLTKKVIITDIDLSMTVSEVKTPIKKIVTKIEEVNSVKSQPNLSAAAVTEEIIIVKETLPEVLPEQAEKKYKKKKKNRTIKSVQNGSLSGSNATLNTSDDSYELLLESRLLSETLEKTNDDISLELEKLIQKGMYSSLQEKIKSINVEPEADGFFKNFDAVPSPAREKASTSNGFMKTPDFNRIFQSTRQFLKPNMVSVEQDNSDNKVAVDDIRSKDTKTSSSAPDAADSSAGLFLDNGEEVQEVPKIRETTTDVSLKPDASSKENEDQDDKKKLYPITQAVKEWMSKTREVTPEVEILKSPSTIQREFGGNDSPDDTLNDPLDSDEEDEVTLFSTDHTLSQEQPDHLKYWENNVPSPETVLKDCEKSDIISNNLKVCSDANGCAKCQNANTKEGEEEIDVYESKYGQNDAFLKLQQELKEKQINASCPENLPYRTVCCNLQ